MGGSGVLAGWDASGWQGGVYSGGGGFSFALAKATEGYAWVDPAFERHLASIRAHGLVAGAYAFGCPELGPPEPQADFFVAVVRSVVSDLRGLLLALDLEVGRGPLAAWRDRFCDRVELLAGVPCWWYSYDSFLRTRALNTGGTRYPFWDAWPDANGSLPTYAFGRPRMQQWGLTTVPGIGGMVDANRFFGTIADLRALTVGGSVAPAPSTTPIRGDEMPLMIPRRSGGYDVFGVMPDGALRHALLTAPGAVEVPFDDPLPGRWASVFAARWSTDETHLEVFGFGWDGGAGGSVWKNDWDVSDGLWVGPTRLAG